MLLFGVSFILYFLKLCNISGCQKEHQLHVFIFDFDHIEQIYLVFLLLILETNLTIEKLIKEEHDSYQNQQQKF